MILTLIRNMVKEVKEILSYFKQNKIRLFIIILILISLPIGIFLVQNTQIFKSRALQTQTEDINSLTKSLIETGDLYNISSAQNKQELSLKMISLAADRKQKLLDLLKENPVDFLTYASLEQKKDFFPENVASLLETEVLTEGVLTVTHLDNFDDDTSKVLYELKTDDQISEVIVVDKLAKFKTGQNVLVNGIKLDSTIVTLAENISSKELQKEISKLITDRGDLKFLIVPLYSSNNPKPADKYSKQLKEDLFSNISTTKSVNNYLKETTFEKISISGDILDWHGVLPLDSYCQKSETELLEKLHEIKSQLNIANLSSYKGFIYLYPEELCGVIGRSFVGTNEILMGHVLNDYTASKMAPYYTHEIGHLLGLGHANSYSCQENIIAKPEECKSLEYGDRYDVMGLVYPDTFPHFNAPHKIDLNVFEPSNIVEVKTSGVYTISPLETQTNQPQVIKIKRPYDQSYYYLEYRQPLGYDSNLPEKVTRGFILHLQSWILNMAAGPAFIDDQVFDDPLNGIQIKQINHNANNVTVSIKISAPLYAHNLLSDWRSTTSLPAKIVYQASVASKNYFYSIGGAGNPYYKSIEQQQIFSDVYYSKIADDGQLAKWNKIINLPKPLVGAGTTIIGDYIYVIGGFDGQKNSNDIYFAKIKEDGSLDQWVNLKEASLVNGVIFPVLFRYSNYLYIASREEDQNLYVLKVNPNGTLEPQKVQKLPTVLGLHQFNISAVVNKNLLYLFTYIIYQGNLSDDRTINWRSDTLKSPAIFENRVVLIDNYLFSVAGDKVYSATFDDKGGIGTWFVQNSTSPKGENGVQVVNSGKYIYVLGGVNWDSRPEEIYYTKLISENIPKQTPTPTVTPTSIPTPTLTPTTSPIPTPTNSPIPTNTPLSISSVTLKGPTGDTDIPLNSQSINYWISNPSTPLESMVLNLSITYNNQQTKNIQIKMNYRPLVSAKKCVYKPYPIRSKYDQSCSYSQTSCFESTYYKTDFNCDTKHYYTDNNFTISSLASEIIPEPKNLHFTCISNGTQAKLEWESDDIPLTYYQLRVNLAPISTWAPGVSDTTPKVDVANNSYIVNIGNSNPNNFSVQTIPLQLDSATYGVNNSRSEELEFSCTIIPPQILQASCSNKEITITWNQINDPKIFYHVRGKMTNDSQFIPDENWTNGVDRSQIISNNAGENVVCSNQVCQYKQNVPADNYRIWVDSFYGSAKSKNAYYPNLVNCQ